MNIANCPGKLLRLPPTSVTHELEDDTDVLYITVAFVLFVLAELTVIVPEFSEVSVPTDVMFG